MAGLRAVIVGAGRIAGGYDEGRRDGKVMTHAGAYRAHGGFEIAACIEPDASRRELFMDYWDIPTGFANLDEWIASGDGCDVVSLCSPSEHHDEMLRLLSKFNIRAIWAEKPLTTNLDRADELATILTRTGIAVAVGYLRRWDPEMQRLRAGLRDGSLGALQAAVVYYGGGLINNGSHALDLLHDWFGTLEIVSARRSRIDGNRADPTYDVWLSTENGATIQLIGVDADRFTMFEWTLVTTAARIDIDDHGFIVRRRDADDDPSFHGRRSLGPIIERESGLGRAMVAIAGELHDAVSTGGKVRCGPCEAAAALSLCATIRRAAGG